ncbi:hypothetical protein [Streptomyces scabiei]|uniref:Uncharacterized protein n=1 Tax=Streptomyces scabiei TaxID=1930 RepID=A0A100JTG2_STRSC|nr:hypothetical protein [Streptomyces scabiei]GAQ65365.1 hypothetical protein SsS58_05774 [Streptomyces scabiei]
MSLTSTKVHLPVTGSAIPDQVLNRNDDCHTLHAWQPPITASTSPRR